MKILQVSGENLASLERPFAVDFENGPLGAAGLFGITGPTGAGKSTLLDAVCLPLYDRTPRLSGHGGAEVGAEGEDTLRSADVRSILRKGAGSGWAEVLFEGKDGRRYRARWSVRRARNAPGGRLQSQALELYDGAGGQSLGGTKTETLERVEAVLGLTFEQFCRSVLLAQGDFAAFLGARAGERAELLERMTGTGVYAELSQAAFRQARDAQGELRVLEERLAGAALLGEEARADLAARVAALDGQLGRAQGELEEARRAEQWWGTRSRLAREAEAAAAQRAAASRAWGEGAADRDLLARVRKSQPLRGVVREADRAREDREHAAAELARREEELQEARAALRRAEEARAAGAGRLEEARAERERLRPELALARELDVLLARAHRDRQEAAAALDVTRREAEAAETAAAERGSRKDAVVRALAEAQGWLSAHREDEPVAREWGRWESELARCGEALSALAELSRRKESAAEARGAAGARQGTAEEGLAAAREALRAASGLLEVRRTAAAELSPRDLLTRQGALAARERRLSALRGTAAEARRLLGEAEEAAGRAGAFRAQAAEEERAAGEWETRRGELQGSVEAARASLRAAELSASLEAHRGQLEPGAPCPLCGATDHPWSGAGAPEPPEAGRQRREVGELEEASRTAGAEVAAARQRAQAAVRRAQEEDRRGEQARREAEDLRCAWGGHGGGLEEVPLPADPTDPASLPAVDGALEAVRAALARVGETLQDAEQRASAAEAAQTAADAARDGLDAARRERDASGEALRDADRALEEICAREQQEGRSLERALGVLRGVLPGWEEARLRLLADPVTFRKQWECRAGAWLDRDRRRATAQEALAELEPQVRATAAEVRALGEQRRKAVEAHRQADAAHADLSRRRRALLGGQGAEEAEGVLDGRIGQAERADREAQRRAEAAGNAYSGSEARVGAARSALEDAVGREAAARQALAQTLAARDLSLEDLRALLAHGERWIEETGARLEGLERAHDGAATLWDERCRVLAAHEATDAPALADAEVAAALRLRLGEAERLQEARQEARLQLLRDDEERARVEALRPRVEEQRRRTAVWAALAELIGSHDGKKFRTFAQSLTLDVLLAHANEHLGSLVRRYRLERVPGSELDLQVVDQDMGDEVRSVNSLSGGESFLVSLALALGLSSLSARDTRVESLFVDEGFGSLDPDTLDAAMATLDALQASGRRVGVISHVPGLAERIGARVEVRPCGGGASTVRVRGAA